MAIEFRALPFGDRDFQLFADHGGAILALIGVLTYIKGLLVFQSDDDDLQGAVMWDMEPGMKMSEALPRVKAAYLALCEDRRREAEAERRDEGAHERMMDAWADNLGESQLDLERHNSLHPDGYASPYRLADWGPYEDLEDAPPVPR